MGREGRDRERQLFYQSFSCNADFTYLLVLLEHSPQMAETSLGKNVIETGGGNISMMIVHIVHYQQLGTKLAVL